MIFVTCTQNLFQVPLLLCAGSALFVCLFAGLHYYCIQWRFLWQLRRTIAACDPAIPPYFFPYAGHAIQILMKPQEFLRGVCSMARRPVALYFFGETIHMAMPGEQTRWLFHNSARLAPTPSLLDALTRFCGLSRADQHMFLQAGADQSRNTLKDQSRDFAKYLRGKNLRCIIKRFQQNFSHEIDLHVGVNWVSIPDLYGLIASCIFRAEVEALYGKGIFLVCPALNEHFWRFYKSVPLLARGLPWWLAPASHRAQRQMQDDMMAWRSWCLTQTSEDMDCPDLVEFDPLLGSLYIRQMCARHETLGLSRRGVACALLGYLFVTVANSIPVALWMLLHILKDASLNTRICSEIEQLPRDDVAVPREQVSTMPLLNAVYCEVLRLHTAGTIGRTPLSDVQLPGGCRLQAGVPVMTSSWLGGLDDSFWNTGTQEHPHPTTFFWAERFLKCTDNPIGPILEGVSPLEPAKSQVISKGNGLEGYWFPFGGGASRCPGESLARHTILTSVITVLKAVEMELVDTRAAKATRSNHRTLPFGSHAFDRPVPILVRRADNEL